MRRFVALLAAGLLGITVVASGAMAAAVDSSKPRIFGHRGDMAVVLENSRAGITSAVRNGAYGVEFDVRITSTGYAVVMHDSTMTRTSSMCAGKYVHKMTGTQFKACKLNNGENAPSLDNYFYHGNKKSMELRYFLELKVVPTKVQAERIIATMKKYSIPGRVKIISFSTSALKAMRDAGWTGRMGWLFTSSTDWAKNLSYDRHPFGVTVAKSLVDAAHASGLRVAVGSHDYDDMVNMLSLGIDETTVNNVKAAVANKAKAKNPPTTPTTTTTTDEPTTTEVATTTTSNTECNVTVTTVTETVTETVTLTPATTTEETTTTT